MHIRREPAVRALGHGNAFIANGEQAQGRILEDRAITVTSLVTSTVSARPAVSATQVAIGVIPASIDQSPASPTSTSTFTVTVKPSTSSAASTSSTSAKQSSTTSSSASPSTSSSAARSTSSTQQTTSSRASSTSSSAAPSTTAPAPAATPVSGGSKGATSSASSSGTAAESTASAGSKSDMSTVSSAVHRSSVPPGAIGAIVAVVILVVLGLGFLLVRRYFIRKRQARRKTWGAGLVAAPDFSDTEQKYEQARAAGTAPSIRSYGGADSGDARSFVDLPNPYTAAPSTYAAANALAAPAMSYNNPAPPPVTPSVSMPVNAAGAAALANAAVVRCTFIPSLPDELSITTGETVRVIGEYDDGWALCVNGRGEQGMVPVECLDRSLGGRAGLPPPISVGTADWRASKRVSSLASPRFAKMT